MEAEYYRLLCECLNKLQAACKQPNPKNESKRPSSKLRCHRVINNTDQQPTDRKLKKQNRSRWIRSNLETDDDSGVRTQRFYSKSSDMLINYNTHKL